MEFCRQTIPPMTAKLRFLGLKPRTLQCYKAALHHFFQWLQEEHYAMPSRFTELDNRLAEYLEHLWFDNFHITYAGHTLSALRRFHPQSRYKTPLARQFFSNWRAIHHSQQAVPMPWLVAVALAGVAWRLKDERFAITVLLGFAAFLRTGEMTNIQVADIAVYLQASRIILALPSTKTSKQAVESVEIQDCDLCPLVAHVVSTLPEGPLCGLKPNQFRARLKLYLKFFGLQAYCFSAYSIRRGGASHAFASGTHFDELLLRGRWQSVKTARIYLDSGRASLVRMSFSADVQAHLLSFQQSLLAIPEQLRRKRSKHR